MGAKLISASGVSLSQAGFGSEDAELAIYLANRPPLDDYPLLDHVKPLLPGELAHIVANTSNHWRKVFNVYAKFLQALAWDEADEAGTWQKYRDKGLLQSGCREALLFSSPVFTQELSTEGCQSKISIVAGKTYAAQLALPTLTWLDAYFAINRDYKVIVCPYLDYRQLSNERIDRLAGLVRELSDAR
ncbi:hypothetical protein KOI40_11185 [Aestuariicella sp. G3-2]|nr:hypothetical protein [Aestuariicella albida]